MREKLLAIYRMTAATMKIIIFYCERIVYIAMIVHLLTSNDNKWYTDSPLRLCVYNTVWHSKVPRKQTALYCCRATDILCNRNEPSLFSSTFCQYYYEISTILSD